MNYVNIGGRIFKGLRSISVMNNRVIIDGKDVTEKGMSKDGILEIKVTGILNDLRTDASVIAENIDGDVQAGGSVSCNNVGGDVQTGGSVSCGKVGGDIMAGGSVSHG